jgi:hypothetical protein
MVGANTCEINGKIWDCGARRVSSAGRLGSGAKNVGSAEGSCHAKPLACCSASGNCETSLLAWSNNCKRMERSDGSG